MFDFIFSEVWWMEIIVSALIGGIVTLLAAFWAIGPKLKALSKEHENLKEDHKLRAQEHEGIKEKIEDRYIQLYKEHRGIEMRMENIRNTIQYVKDETIKVAENRHALTSQQLDIQKTVLHISAMMDELQKLQARCAVLEHENKELKARLQSKHRYEEPEL